MINEDTPLTAGLIFLGSRDLDIVALGNRISTLLEAMDQKVSGIRILSDEKSLVRTQSHDISMEVKQDERIPGLRGAEALMLEIIIANSQDADPDVETTDATNAETILAHVLKTLQRRLSAEFVQWYTGDTLLRGTDFARAVTRAENSPPSPERRARLAIPTSQDVATVGVAPARVSQARLFPSVEETNEILQTRMTQKQVLTGNVDIQSDLRSIFRENRGGEDIPLDELDEDIEAVAPLRLSAWAFSFSVALFALPIGAILVVLNLMKGENLRLASQTAALTGTFIALNAYGATAEAMTVLSKFVD